MSRSSSKHRASMDDIREVLIDFGLPAMVLMIAGLLIFSGRDGELKTVFAAASGWLFKSGYTEYKHHRRR